MTSKSDLKLLALTPSGQSSETKKSDGNGNVESLDSQTQPSNFYIRNTVLNGNHVDQATVSKAATLEQRYIELLEKRIASLEEALEMEYLPEKGHADDGEDQEVNGYHKKEDGKEQKGNKDTDIETNKVDPSEIEALVGKKLEPDTADQSGGATTSIKDSGSQADSTEKAKEPSRVRFREIRYNDGFQVTTDTVGCKEPTADRKEENTNYAFIWSREYDRENKYSHTIVEIQSETLADLLKANLSHYLWFPHHDKVIKFSSPFEIFVHNWTKLLDVAKPCSGDNHKQGTAKKDLQQLMKQISTSEDLVQYFQDFDPVNKPKTVTFNFLWTIFPPGCLVYSAPVMQKDQVLILQCSETEEPANSKKKFSLTCWAYDWNGETFNRVPYDFFIESFSGTKSINTLDHYPLGYHRDSKGIRTRLISRGQRYRQLCICKSGSQMFDYNGFSIEDQKGITRKQITSRSFTGRSSAFRSQGEETTSERVISPKLKGHIIVDFFSYNQYVAGGGRMGFEKPVQPYKICTCEICFENEALMETTRCRYDGVDKTQEFTEEQYLICPPRVLGYLMVRKTWAQLLVEDVRDLEKNNGDAFSKLVLEHQQKTLIRSLVSKHGDESVNGEGGSQQVEDIVEGKGKSVVILLHGPPGVGKSLTAESVAQITNKPLFAVSVADIGLKPAEVEFHLSQLFNLASLWKAVLLFDEADVFLDARDKSDMERNALVSVLLRVMEYYEGILILTTNRIKTFDVAVQSRVHLAIRFQDLSVEDRKKIFKNFYNQLTTENCDELKAIKDYIDDFDQELNGRQIRNVFSSAMALARERNEKVCLQDFKQVVKVTREFQKYLMEESLKARQRVE